MEQYTMAIDWKTQYCEDVSSFQIELHIQCVYNWNSSIFNGNSQILKFICKCKGSKKVKTILKKNKGGDVNLPNWRPNLKL